MLVITTDADLEEEHPALDQTKEVQSTIPCDLATFDHVLKSVWFRSESCFDFWSQPNIVLAGAVLEDDGIVVVL